jgi:pimeloyl-ACP methyl ester carboxylesterase
MQRPAPTDSPPPASGVTAVLSGHGPDIVLVHGALGDWRQWTGIAGQLDARYRIIAVSRRSHWPHVSASPDVPYTYETHRDDLLAYLRLLPGAVHLVGHSWGAGVVLLAALARPWIVKTLTLIEPAFHSLLPDAGAGLESELEDRAKMLAAVRSLVAEGRSEEAARLLIDWTQGGAGRFDELPAAARSALLENAPTVGPNFSTTAPDVSLDDLRQLAAPAMVAHGEHTRPYYRAIAEAAAAALPQATLRVIPGARHMSIVERPEQVAGALEAFISSA